MNILSNKFPERLYLSKDGGGDIYVNDCQKLRRNQIDSLRGLYKLFKKKVPGVILNNASDSGKTVTVVLFIEAVQKLLTDPVLILCNHNHEVQYWEEMLLKWTNYTEDNIALESTNPYLKKSIFIQKSCDLANSFFRRNWSVLVLKDDEITKEVDKMVFNAEFKIWVTTVDVFRDLKMLSCLGKFLNPKMNVNLEDFETENQNVIEKIKTVVLLQSFADDFVVRTDDLKSILQKKSNPDFPSPIRKKNKDATGTKIKKTKRKLCEDTQSTSANKKASIENNTNEIKCNKGDKGITDVDDQDSPSVLNLKSFVDKNNTSFGNNVVNDTTENRNDKIDTHNGNKNYEYFEDNDDATDVDTKTHFTPFSEHSTQCLTDEGENEANELNTETSQVNLIYSEDVKIEKNEVPTAGDLTNNITNDIEQHIAPDFNKMKSDETETEVYEKDTVDLNTESLQLKLDNTEDLEMKINDQSTKHVQETESNHDITKDINTTTVNVKNQTFDQKMSELEAKTLLKFKGSILDNIF